MNKEIISDQQAISLIVMYFLAEASTLVMGLEGGKDLWLAIIMGIFMALPMMIIYSGLNHIFSGKNLFDIIEFCFGKFIGKGIILLFTCHIFHLAAIVLGDFGGFVTTISLPETPMIVPIILESILVIWIVKEGIEVAGRWAAFFLPFVIFGILTVILLLIPQMHINNILPALTTDIKPIVKGAFGVFSIPLSEAIVFTMVFSNFKTEKSSYKIYIHGLLIGGILIFAISLTNILVLGVDIASALYFPSYALVARLNIADFLQRLEAISAIIFILGGFIKVSILLLAATKGLTKFFGYTDYRFMVTPIALLACNLSYFEFDSIMHYDNFNKIIYPYYSFPFQVILPIMILVTAVIKKKRLKLQNQRDSL